MQNWEQPKVVKLQSLPEVFGACTNGATASGPCTTGSTYVMGACKTGQHASTKCEAGGQY